MVIDPVAGSGSTLVAALELGRKPYEAEIKDFYKQAKAMIEEVKLTTTEIKELGYAKTKLNKIHPTLF